MWILKVMVLMSVCLMWVECENPNPYCELCKDHTLCIYEGIGKKCKQSGDSGVTEEQKKEIIDLHNYYRRQLALGKETRGKGGGQPAAADMMKLVWDDELAQSAQRWADQCPTGHDACRKVKRWNVGQNFFWIMKEPENPVNWTYTIDSWYNEIDGFNPKGVAHYRFDTKTGHFTQLVWHDTTHVGCGRKDFGSTKVYVCNYGPTGNIAKHPLYVVGEACTKCPTGTNCDDHLCALPDQKFRTSLAEGQYNPELPPAAPKLALPQNEISGKANIEKSKILLKTSRDDDSNISQSEKTYKEDEREVPVDRTTDPNKDFVLDEASKNEMDRIHYEIEKLLKCYVKKFRQHQKDPTGNGSL